MKEFEALKNIWNSQKERTTISSDDLLKRLRKEKRSFEHKLLGETIIAGITILLLAVIWIASTFIMWTTHLSMLIFVCCCFYYLFTQYRDYRSMNSNGLLLKRPDEYLEYLKTYRRRRYILNTRKYTIYSIFIGIAFSLYFVEIYFTAPLWQMLLGVLFIAGWFMACWVLMRSYIRKEEHSLEIMISNLERLQKQFDNVNKESDEW